MNVTPIKTHKITTKDTDLLKIHDTYIKKLHERSIVVIASKIVAITQGRVVDPKTVNRDELIIKEADLYLPKEKHRHNLFITIKDNYLTYSSGIDESNSDGDLVLWPKNVQKTTNEVREHLKKRFKLKHIGVIVTDMAAIPLKWGVIGGALSYSGFEPLKDLRGKPDVFGRKFEYTKVGILNGLATAAAVVMGEGNEQTPIGIISDIPFVKFVNRNPTNSELNSLKIEPSEDLYGPLLSAVSWKKGGT